MRDMSILKDFWTEMQARISHRKTCEGCFMPLPSDPDQRFDLDGYSYHNPECFLMVPTMIRRARVAGGTR